MSFPWLFSCERVFLLYYKCHKETMNRSSWIRVKIAVAMILVKGLFLIGLSKVNKVDPFHSHQISEHQKKAWHMQERRQWGSGLVGHVPYRWPKSHLKVVGSVSPRISTIDTNEWSYSSVNEKQRKKMILFISSLKRHRLV